MGYRGYPLGPVSREVTLRQASKAVLLCPVGACWSIVLAAKDFRAFLGFGRHFL
jgi:hypothetical protein